MTIPLRIRLIHNIHKSLTPTGTIIAEQSPLLHAGKHTKIISQYGAHIALEEQLPAFIASDEPERTVLNNGYKFKLIKKGALVIGVPLAFFAERSTRRLDRLKNQRDAPYFGVVFPTDLADQLELEKHNLGRNIKVLSANCNPRAIGTFALRNYGAEVKFIAQTHIRVSQSTRRKTKLKQIARRYTYNTDWRTSALEEIRKMTKKPITVFTRAHLVDGEVGFNLNHLKPAYDLAQKENQPLPLNGYTKPDELGIKLPPK